MNTTQNKPINSPEYYTVMGVAVVSGVFSLIVAAFLAFNYISDQFGLPDKEVLYSNQLLEKKVQLSQEPRNEELKKEIRGLDLELRQGFFQRKAFAERGKYLLLAGVVICVLALKRAPSFQKHPRRRKPVVKDPGIEARGKLQARMAVGVLGLTLVGVFLGLAYLPRVELPSTIANAGESNETTAPVQASYPSREEYMKNWPVFRGPSGRAQATYENMPASFDGASGEGILWKTAIPVHGNSSPIVWGDRLFLSGADENTKEVMCFSTETGELLWRGSVNDVPKDMPEDFMVNEDNGLASCTMACDNSRAYALFGDGDIACFDFNGQRLWAKNLGVPDSIYGYAASLVNYQDRVLIQFDQGSEDDGKSMMIALDGKTGAVAWQTPRPVGSSWTSPIVADLGNEAQLVTVSEPWVIGYNPETGEELWRAKLMGTDLAPSPIMVKDLAIAIQPNEAIYAIRSDGRGDVTETHVAWTNEAYTPDICSPAANEELIFLLASGGSITCIDAQSGETVWENEVEGYFMASPIVAGGWVYVIDQDGLTYRVKAAREYEVSEPFSLGEAVISTPAFLDGRIYIRGVDNLYCIGSRES